MQMTKFIGKPYAGKPHVRIEEGAGKVFVAFPLYSTGSLFYSGNTYFCHMAYIELLQKAITGSP